MKSCVKRFSWQQVQLFPKMVISVLDIVVSHVLISVDFLIVAVALSFSSGDKKSGGKSNREAEKEQGTKVQHRAKD